MFTAVWIESPRPELFPNWVGGDRGVHTNSNVNTAVNSTIQNRSHMAMCVNKAILVEAMQHEITEGCCQHRTECNWPPQFRKQRDSLST